MSLKRAVILLSLASTAPVVAACDSAAPNLDGAAASFLRQGCTNVERLRVADAWAITRGSPQTIIAILDTGLAASSQNADDTVPGRDFVANDANVVDAEGHGTALYAAIKGAASGQPGDAGVCPACKVMPLRVVADASTDAFDVVDARLAAALRFARDNGAQIALVGLVADSFPPATAAAVADVIASGVTVVAPAGADKRGFAAFPARLPGVVSVSGSTAIQDYPHDRANGFGAVDVWAPSDGASWPGLGAVNGTSLASAYVAGVLGLMKSAQPSLSPAAMRSLLVASSVPLEPGEPMQLFGGGRVDARAAVDLATANPGAVVDVTYAEPFPARALPGQPAVVHARIQNHGTQPVDRATLSVVVDPVGASAPAGAGTLAPGDGAWVDVPYTSSTRQGKNPMRARVVAAGAAVDVSRSARDVVRFATADPGEQMSRLLDPTTGACPGHLPLVVLAKAQRRAPVVDYASTKNVRLLDFDETTPPGAAPASRTFVARFVNAGNTSFTAGATASLDGQTIATLDDAPWDPGVVRELPMAIAPAQAPQEASWLVSLAPSVADDDGGDDRLAVRVASGAAPRFDLAYADYDGSDIEFDAPYRINVDDTGTTTRSADDDFVPFLAFVPQYSETLRQLAGDDAAVVFAITVRADHPAATRQSLDSHGRPPAARWDGADGARLVYATWRNGDGSSERAYCTSCVGLEKANEWTKCMKACDEVAPAPDAPPDDARWRPTILDENGAEIFPTDPIKRSWLFAQSDPLHYVRPATLPQPAPDAHTRELFDASFPGWHRVIRIPRKVLFGALGRVPSAPSALYFNVLMGIAGKGYRAPVGPPLNRAWDDDYEGGVLLPFRDSQSLSVWSRTLRVVFDRLPRFRDRPNDRYYDAHVHTMAEGTISVLPLGDALFGKGKFSSLNKIPAQKWGAPIAMLTDSAFAQGFTPVSGMDAQVSRVVVTDHNEFYSDESDGIPPAWIPPTGPLAATRDPNSGFLSHHGELALARKLFGRAAGEELAVAGGLPPASGLPNGGRHALVYDADHFEGPWHGDTGNPWSVAHTLDTMKAKADQGQGPVPSIFPAHPFQYTDPGQVPDPSSPTWRVYDLEQLFGMWPKHSRNAYSEKDAKGNASLVPLAPGYQVRNQKIQARAYEALVDDYKQLDAWKYLLSPKWFTSAYGPKGEPPSSALPMPRAIKPLSQVDLTKLNPTTQKGWRGQFVQDLALYSYLVREGLQAYRLADDPTADPAKGERIYMRKVFGVGGNDAHGDFNFERLNISTLLDCGSVRGLASLIKVASFGSSTIPETVRTASGVDDAAWGRIRTLALTDSSDPTSAFDAMLSGNAIVTDGPLVRLEVNANPYVNQAAMDAAVAGHPIAAPIYSLRQADADSHFDVDGSMGGTGPMGGTGTVLAIGIDGRARINDTNGGEFTGNLWNTHCEGCWLGVPRLRFTVVNPYGLYDPFPDADATGRPALGQVGGHEGILTDVVAVLVRPNRLGPDVKVMATYTPVPRTTEGLAMFEDDVHDRAPYINAMDTSMIKGVLPSDGDDGARTSPTFGQRAAVFLVAERDPLRGGSTWGGGMAATTNPVWIAVARIDEFLVNATIAADGTPTVTEVRARVVFPISMKVPAQVFLQQVQDDAGTGALVPAGDIHEITRGGSMGVDGIAGRELEFNWTGLTMALAPGKGGRRGVALYVYRPHDILDNALNSIAVFRQYPSSLPVSPLNDNHQCEFVAGACPACSGNLAVPWCQKYAPTGAKCASDRETFCEYGNKTLPFLFAPVCVDLQSDPTNCGACGHSCAVDEECCGGSCVAIDDPRNCGACGTACLVGQQCCHDPTRADGRPMCTGLASNDNCGACGLACPSGSTCQTDPDGASLCK